MIEIYNQDCIDGMRKLENESIDAIITDPPYGIDFQSHRRDKNKRHRKITGDKQPYIWFLNDAARVLKDGGVLLCFCRWDTQNAFKSAIEWAGLRVKSIIVWDRQHHGMGDLKGAFAPQYDLIIFATKGRFTFAGTRPKDVIRVMRLDGNLMVHPNEKPVELMRKLIEAVTVEGQIILDCFAGSGSTAIACGETKRNFLGFEIDKAHYSLCLNRINKLEK